jgi:hypothetical protein
MYSLHVVLDDTVILTVPVYGEPTTESVNKDARELLDMCNSAATQPEPVTERKYVVRIVNTETDETTEIE